jgi:hypothetical protein
VVICMWTAPLNVVRFGATTLWHLDAEERAPSTTSSATGSGLKSAAMLLADNESAPSSKA